MIWKIYFFILAYFILGAIGFYFINRKKTKADARKNRIKFIAYFFIIHILFFSIVLNPLVFRYISVLIVVVAFWEILALFRNSAYRKRGFFILSALVLGLLSLGFLTFGKLGKEVVLFTFLILSIFDSFSQISGQIWGREKIFPTISPNKTVGGVVGGAIIALLSGIILRTLTEYHLLEILLLTVGILFFAFAGDLAASFYKRNFEVKDYNNLIPGHGGFLDRFDSLISGGAWVALFSYLANI